jgi:hypothetical protein
VIYTVKNVSPKGHPYDEENTRYRARGSRDCRACDREAHRKGKK